MQIKITKYIERKKERKKNKIIKIIKINKLKMMILRIPFRNMMKIILKQCFA